MRLSLLLALLLPAALPAQAPRSPILFDTDIGTDIDDAFALGLILASPELHLLGVSAVGDPVQQRAMLLCRFLTFTGRRHVQVAVGAGKHPQRKLGGQYQFYYHPDAIFNRTIKPVKESAADYLYNRLKAQSGKITIVATGPLTNIAKMIEDKPDSIKFVRRIIFAGGSKDKPEANVKADLKAAQTVFKSGVPLVVVPANITDGLKLTPKEVKRVFSPGTTLTRMVQTLYQLWDQDEPTLAAVVAAALCISEKNGTFQDAALEIDDKGLLRAAKGKNNARLLTKLDRKAFLNWYVDRMASTLPPAKTPTKFVTQGAMPHRVHVSEDYDLDIERHWWMAGKSETKNLPAGSKRACRGVLTHDFDDLLGHMRKMYTAVIFNPVPGPPMGKNTRLSFKYWIKGTDTLRVQIYTLTNHYHRHLILKNLTQGKWQSGTVDMTVARRRDGTGGPLSEGERIDDIQFYADPDAELIIDDVVLFDAAAAGEKRPFPKRIHFTGMFDSGEQAKHWPGTFDLVKDKGFFWHAAKSVENDDLKTPWIRLGLRGDRPMGDTTEVSFRYNLTGAGRLKVVLVGKKERWTTELKGLKKGAWAQATADFAKVAGLKKGTLVREIHFLPPKGAELLADDVLLYEPGK